jgi:hypothetical protein
MDFPLKITGYYNSKRQKRLFLWECPSCQQIWKDEKKRDKPTETITEYAILRKDRWQKVAKRSIKPQHPDPNEG